MSFVLSWRAACLQVSSLVTASKCKYISEHLSICYMPEKDERQLKTLQPTITKAMLCVGALCSSMAKHDICAQA